MVKIRTWRLVIVGLVLAVLGQAAVASDPTAPEKKTECPKECDARAKAAFAFAKLKAEAATAKTAPATAPMPKPVESKKVGVLCYCGDSCRCAPGDCPGKCPASGVSGIAETVTRPPTLQRSWVIVRYECQIVNGQRVCVPIYELR